MRAIGLAGPLHLQRRRQPVNGVLVQQRRGDEADKKSERKAVQSPSCGAARVKLEGSRRSSRPPLVKEACSTV